MKSWKIGAIAGLIAGIVASIISIFFIPYLLENGLEYWGLQELTNIPLKEIAIVEIPLHIIWGIMLGVIFSRVYGAIPGKGIVKGLVVGLILYIIIAIRWFTFDIIYSLPDGWPYYFILYVPMGLALGISYEFLGKRYISKKEQFTPIKYDLKGAFYPSAIAGIVSGVSSFLFASVIINPLMWSRYVEDIGFLVSELGSLVMFDMIWGIVFGMLYAVFYERIPKKGILKGLVFSLGVYLFTNVLFDIHPFLYYQILPIEYSYLIWGFWGILAGLSVFVPFGIVLGLLYRKPPK